MRCVQEPKDAGDTKHDTQREQTAGSATVAEDNTADVENVMSNELSADGIVSNSDLGLPDADLSSGTELSSSSSVADANSEGEADVAADVGVTAESSAEPATGEDHVIEDRDPLSSATASDDSFTDDHSATERSVSFTDVCRYSSCTMWAQQCCRISPPRFLAKFL